VNYDIIVNMPLSEQGKQAAHNMNEIRWISS